VALFEQCGSVFAMADHEAASAKPSIVGSIDHVLRGTFKDLYAGDGSGSVSADAAPASLHPAATSDDIEEAKEVRSVKWVAVCEIYGYGVLNTDLRWGHWAVCQAITPLKDKRTGRIQGRPGLLLRGARGSRVGHSSGSFLTSQHHSLTFLSILL
jgi:hypothetical protein